MNDKTQTTAKFDFAYIADAPINPESPWDNDVLQRQELANHLTNLVKGAEDSPFVISVNGGWGSGKTFMLKRWRQQLINPKNKNGFGGKAIYFNAWEDDFHANPLVAIIGQLWKELKQDDWKEIINSLKKIIPTIACKKCLGFLGLDKTNLQSTAEQTVDEYLETRKKIDELKERLKTLAATVKKQTGMPLVFVVDELDRCRPTFAIELLERIKHVFGVPNIVFVFGINKTQLEESIHTIYGKTDAEDYLRKFFDINLNLPSGISPFYCQHLLKKYRVVEFINNSGVHERNKSWKETMESVYITMSEYMAFSLRETEQVIRMLFVVLTCREMQPNKEIYRQEGFIVVCFMFLRMRNYDLYEKFIQRKCLSNDVVNEMFKFIPDEAFVSSSVYSNHMILCVEIIAHVFYRFAESEERDKIVEELKIIKNGIRSHKYVHVSEKITRPELVKSLLNALDENSTYRDYYEIPPQRIAKLLEWGIY